MPCELEPTSSLPRAPPVFPGHASSQDPEDWWNGLGDAVRKAVESSGVPKAEIVGLGMDTTCCSVVALDESVSASPLGPPRLLPRIPVRKPCV